MKKLSNTYAKLKKRVVYKKRLVSEFNERVNTEAAAHWCSLE